MSEEVLPSSDTLLSNIETHFKVIAGPGAGKTRWLINHIINVAQNSSRLATARKIACITYTNVGVETIISRLGDSVDRVEVSTIHSFLYKHVLKPFIFLVKDTFGINPAELDGHDEVMPTPGLLHQWKTATRQTYLEDDQKTVSALTSLCWKFNDQGEIELQLRDFWRGQIGTYNIRKESYLEYKKMLWEKNLLHHDDVLYFSYILLRDHENIRRVIRSKFPYFFIDEFQDTNPIQARIIDLLAEKETIVGVIGDGAQSIYEFQGADVAQFNNFTLPNMQKYRIENNHRSTQEILKILNHMRRDITQTSPENLSGPKPLLVIGPSLLCVQHIKTNIINDVCTLSYSNVTANEMRTGRITSQADDCYEKLYFVDSSTRRKYVIFNAVKAVEYAKKNRFKEAIKTIVKACEKNDGYEGRKNGLKLLHLLISKYSEYQNGTLLDFYSTIKTSSLIPGMEQFRAGQIKSFYQTTAYSDIAIQIRFVEDNSLNRTIHKSKGAEFDNVLLVIEPMKGLAFSEEQGLSFLLNPNLETSDHRVYYVALSRARKKLFINVPALTAPRQAVLTDVGFEILDLQTVN